MAARIEFWFEFGSNYSYLALMRIEELAARAGVEIAWKPFLLGPVFRELGWESPPFVQHKEKGAYVWRDMERRARGYGLPYRRPSEFPRQAVLPLRVALLGADQPWIGAFCRRIMLRNWAEDREIASPACVLESLAGLVPDPQAVLAAAQSEDNKLALRRQTAGARSLGLFGAPTFLVDGEMFWGDDRLEDAIDAALGMAGAGAPPAVRPGARPLALAALDAPPRARPSNYPQPFAARMAGRDKRALGDLFGLANFGVNLTRLAPGAVSALRHAHSRQDEFVYVVAGHPTLVTDEGATVLAPGMCAGFAAGSGNAHHLVNRAQVDAWYLEVGDRAAGDTASYPDDDIAAQLGEDGGWRFTRKDGRPY